MSPIRADDAFRPIQGRCVLEICRVPFVGGAERIALACARAVQSAGGRVIMACPPAGQLEASARETGLECRPILPLSGRRGLAMDLGRGLLATLANSRALAAIAAHAPVDLIHAHHPIGAFQALRSSGRAGAPLVLHVHETLPAPRQYRALAGWLRRRCHAFICVSDAGRQLIRRLGVAEEKIHLVYNAVEDGFFASPQPAELGPGLHIGAFGVLEPRKGQADLIEALGRLSSTHPTAQLWIVGELSYTQNAGYIEHLKAVAAQWGVSDRVHFTGYRRDVAQLMAAMQVVALASREFESLPTVLLEAMALGRVTVATDVGGVREIVAHGRTGLVVPPGDVASLADALAIALAPSAAALARAARPEAQARFSSMRFEQDLLLRFEDVLRAQAATAH